jgi:hypothetical protein
MTRPSRSCEHDRDGPGKATVAAIGLASQPTVSRWETAPDLRSLIRMGLEMVDIYCASHCASQDAPSEAPPEAVTLDLDDTFDATHGQQQLTFRNGFHSSRRCGAPPAG